MGPLEGFRVIELAEGVAGPQCGMQLAQAGAEVIKLEPLAGDRARGWGSAALGDLGAVFEALNRGKASVAVDFDVELSPALRDLLRSADVVVADVSELPAPWLAYEQLADSNPGLIYVAISGWGARGPWASGVGGELQAQMASEATTGLGAPGAPPVRFAVDLAGAYTSVFAVQAVCAALIERMHSGVGQRVDLSLFGSMMFARTEMWVAMSDQDSWGGTFLENELVPPLHGYRCKDGHIYCSFARSTPAQRQQLIERLDAAWIRDDPLYEAWLADRAAHVGPNAQRVQPLWERAFEAFTRQELIEIIEAHGGEAVAKNDYASFEADPQVQAMRLIQPVADGSVTGRAIAPAWSFASTPLGPVDRVPALGEHTSQFLGAQARA